MIAGCPGTGSAECSDFAFQLWLKVGTKRGVAMMSLPASWLQVHLLQIAVGLISCSPVQPTLTAPRNQVAREKRKAVLELPKWIKEHKFLRAVPVEQGEPSVALLLLWEADHGKAYPSRAVELVGRVSTFTAAVHDAVGVDNELPRWLTSSRMRMQLSGGLPYMPVLRWSVRIDPAVGEPFLGNWKAHLQKLVNTNLWPVRQTLVRHGSD